PFEDRIVQIGAIKLLPDGTKVEKEWLINPGMPIPQIVQEIHGITDEMVKDAPRLGDIAAELQELFDGADLGGYNVKNFDIPLLQVELNRIGLSIDTENIRIIDAMQIFRIKEPRTLAAAYQKYCGKELLDAHDAIADIRASLAVLEGQLNIYDDLPQTTDELHEYCFPKDPDAYDAEGKLRFAEGKLTINFGKNKGKALQELAMNDAGYLEWILNGSFSDKVKGAVREALYGKRQ
ncbi:MAG: DNA polymerase III subunit epsilon, partial [Candidatus Magasanikbacteria bacterium CG10_big_fil_rev_8_21_14_0_10_43_6]